MQKLFDKYSEQIDNEQFDEILQDNSISENTKYKFFNAVYDYCQQVGESFSAKFPGMSDDINRMNNHLQETYPYCGERLWWLMQTADKDSSRYIVYLIYYQHDDYYRVEMLPPKYAWYGSGKDWYICPKHRWDIERLKRVCDSYK